MLFFNTFSQHLREAVHMKKCNTTVFHVAELFFSKKFNDFQKNVMAYIKV
jgi:hypothetical protein